MKKNPLPNTQNSKILQAHLLEEVMVQRAHSTNISYHAEGALWT